MTLTPGAGTTECQDHWTLETVLEDFIVDGKLSRRKAAYLLQNYVKTIDTLQAGLLVSLDVASGYFCSEVELPAGSYWCQVVGSALDFIKPDRSLVGGRLGLLNDLLVQQGHLTEEEAEAYER
jgi:hypothetical protein